MSDKLTPAKAFEHIVALHPSTTMLRREQEDWYCAYDKDENITYSSQASRIEWPDGVDQWPTPPRWETPMLPEDWGRECEFSNDGYLWLSGRLTAYHRTTSETGNGLNWCCTSVYYRRCRIDRNRYPLKSSHDK